MRFSLETPRPHISMFRMFYMHSTYTRTHFHHNVSAVDIYFISVCAIVRDMTRVDQTPSTIIANLIRTYITRIRMFSFKILSYSWQSSVRNDSYVFIRRCDGFQQHSVRQESTRWLLTFHGFSSFGHTFAQTNVCSNSSGSSDDDGVSGRCEPGTLASYRSKSHNLIVWITTLSHSTLGRWCCFTSLFISIHVMCTRLILKTVSLGGVCPSQSEKYTQCENEKRFLTAWAFKRLKIHSRS